MAVAGSWAILALFLVLELGWELQYIGQALFSISPFAHVHWFTQVTAVPLFGLMALAALLAAAGQAGLQRRDMASSPLCTRLRR